MKVKYTQTHEFQVTFMSTKRLQGTEILNVFLRVAKIQVPAALKTSYLTRRSQMFWNIHQELHQVVPTHFQNLTNHERKSWKPFQVPMKNAVLLKNYFFSMSLLPYKFLFPCHSWSKLRILCALIVELYGSSLRKDLLEQAEIYFSISSQMTHKFLPYFTDSLISGRSLFFNDNWCFVKHY